MKKERRDTLLLAFMGVIVIVFLVYTFVPFGGKKENDDGGNISIDKNDEKKIEIPPKNTLPEDNTGESLLNDLNKKIENQLAAIYASIIESDAPFENYNAEGLKGLPGEFKSPLVEKLFKFSFCDLNDIVLLEFPGSYSNSLKYNIFLALFLVKIQEEGIEKKLAELPGSEFEKMIRLDCSRLLNNEIEKDYQLIPVLFYFKAFLNRLSLYPNEDNAGFFKEKIKDLRDLSPGKYLIKIEELLGFSKEMEKYRLEWIEYDSISPNDKQTYTNLNLKTYNFLKQQYLLFPDRENRANNRWIKELCKADSGDIELVLLNIQNENPSKHLLFNEKILYTPRNAQFIVLLKAYNANGDNGFTDRIMTKRIADFHENFTVITFARGQMTGKESFKKELDRFGDYLKKINLIL